MCLQHSEKMSFRSSGHSFIEICWKNGTREGAELDFFISIAMGSHAAAAANGLGLDGLIPDDPKMAYTEKVFWCSSVLFFWGIQFRWRFSLVYCAHAFVAGRGTRSCSGSESGLERMLFVYEWEWLKDVDWSARKEWIYSVVKKQMVHYLGQWRFICIWKNTWWSDWGLWHLVQCHAWWRWLFKCEWQYKVLDCTLSWLHRSQVNPNLYSMHQRFFFFVLVEFVAALCWEIYEVI